jgi:PAS domain S-box-containing protein
LEDPVPRYDDAEGTLRDSERRYRDLVEGARNVVFRLSDQGEFSFLNRTFATITGWAPHEWLGRPFADLVHADDRARVIEGLQGALAGQAGPPFDVRVVPARPGPCVLEVTLVPHRQDDHLAGVIGTAVDVTERREQEASLRRAETDYRQLVESVQAIVWRADAVTLEVRFVSHEAEALLGYPLARWLEEPSFWADHVHPDDREWVCSLRRHAAADARDHEAEYRMIAADGRVLWVRDVVRVRGELPPERELIGFTIDVTERRRAEEEVRRSREQLSDLSAHIDGAREVERASIAREIHDELGQALTALRMDVAWLRMRLPAGSEVTLSKLRGMEELIDETISRARRICSELRPGVLDDLGLEAAVEWQGQEFERRTGVRCEVVSTLQPPPPLDRDLSTALFRILQESLTNVARHAEATRVRVALRQEGGRIVLEVSDDGRGTGAPPAGRRPLGVLGMRERARRLGGTLNITSADGRGTVVQVSIPLARAAEDLAAPELAPPFDPATAVPHDVPTP